MTLAPLGAAVPPMTAHAISVSLPTWEDNIAYEEGDKRVIDAMVTGYPRFFIHRSIQKLAKVCEQKFGATGERSMLFPTRKIAEGCREFMVRRSSAEGSPVSARIVEFVICPDNTMTNGAGPSCVELHIVLFPADSFPLAKQFWQHSGLGISSRLAERCLSMLPDEARPATPTSPSIPSKPSNRHYSAKPARPLPTPKSDTSPADAEEENLDRDHANYLEERYGRNLPAGAAEAAKRAMRRRIAGVLVHDSPSDWAAAGQKEAELGPSTRGVKELSEDDVFLFPTGMAAIWNAHQAALGSLPVNKSVCFGFTYTDTLKILQKWGPGCHFFGYGLDSDIEELDRLLAKEVAENPGRPPVLALFTEFPSNPLLRSPDLPRLRQLADKYDFLIVVDDTIGNYVNVAVLPYADIVVSSLSKIFSGDANVAGGSLVLNPKGRHYSELKTYFGKNFEDTFFDEDALYMERNSRDFKRRIRIIDQNAEAVCDFLRSRSLASSPNNKSLVIKEVYYPKYTTLENYKRCHVPEPDAGFGGLFSLTFTTSKAARVFFDTLPCYKGPSLGTNFTLACPYTLLGHYTELDWAARYGVEADLVRVSIGMEDRAKLLADFEQTLQAAEATIVNA
ncbi:PLP-dependent transferase [Panus rudis PR-1116 ss-1]|nr:PLP-dependent transferase [Panus rudis PR-1116 ss-1]